MIGRFLLVFLALGLFGALSTRAMAQTVRIGTEGKFPPFTYVDRAGELRGFDIDLGREICRRAALKCAFVLNDWNSILDNLLAGKYDVVMAGMAITKARSERVAFSVGYDGGGKTATAVLIRSDGATADWPVVAVQEKTVHADWVRNNGYRAHGFPTLVAAVEAVWQGKADQVIGPLAFLEGAARAGGGKIEITETFGIPAGATAAAFRPEDNDLRRQWDAAIQAMQDDGELDRLRQIWFASGGTD